MTQSGKRSPSCSSQFTRIALNCTWQNEQFRANASIYACMPLYVWVFTSTRAQCSRSNDGQTKWDAPSALANTQAVAQTRLSKRSALRSCQQRTIHQHALPAPFKRRQHIIIKQLSMKNGELSSRCTAIWGHLDQVQLREKHVPFMSTRMPSNKHRESAWKSKGHACM